MKKRINIVFIALSFAVIIPISTSIFLIKKSYELERKKFDIEVTQYTGKIFYSFRADFDLLDSIVNQNFILSNKIQNQANFQIDFNNELRKVYKDYESLADSLLKILKINNYDIDFDYSLEISELKIIKNGKKSIYISNLYGKQKPLVLYGSLEVTEKAAGYSFYFNSTNSYILLKLYIDYPNKNKFLLKKILTLTISILFSMLILIFILLYTVKVLFWQKKVSDMKSLFIDNITHEFNTPVSTLKIISANINKLNLDIKSNTLKQLGLRVENQANRLSVLIGKVMSLSVNEKGNIDYDFKYLQLNKLIEKNVNDFKNNNLDKIKSFKVEINAENDKIIADEYYFSIAVVNILDNAVKYSNKKAEIEVLY